MGSVTFLPLLLALIGPPVNPQIAPPLPPRIRLFFPSGSITSLAQTDDGYLWLGTKTGLGRFDGQAFVFFDPSTSPAFYSERIQRLFVDVHHDLWIRNASPDLVRYHDGQFGLVPSTDLAHVAPPEMFESPRNEAALDAWIPGWRKLREAPLLRTLVTKATAAVRDRNGVCWVGTEEGLLRLEGDRSETLTEVNGLGGKFVRALLEDKEGNLWVGAQWGGLTEISPPRPAVLTPAQGLLGDTVFSLAQGPDGAIWITTTGGLNRYQDGAFTSWKRGLEVPDYALRSVAVTADGTVWIATLSPRLVRFSKGHFTAIESRDELEGQMPTSLMVDAVGGLWVGTEQGGLFRQTSSGFQRMGMNSRHCDPFLAYPPRMVCDEAIASLLPRKAGGIWVGTKGLGLFLWQDGQFLPRWRDTREGGKPSRFFAFHEDADGVLWASAGGLLRVSDSDAVLMQKKDGLFDHGVLAITEDSLHQLWVGAEKGIYRVARQDVDAFARGQLAHIPTVGYTVQDGMKNEEVLGDFQMPVVRDAATGRLYFATVQGVAVFEAPELWPPSSPPQVMIESATCNGRSYTRPLPPGLAIAPGRGDLEFHYTAPTFTSPHRLRFRYRLDGFDPTWVEAGERRTAFYTKVGPGTYTFRVMAEMEETSPSFTFAQTTVVLQPHFHQRPIFFVLLGILAVMLGLAAQWLRLRQARMRFQAILDERTRIARDLHDTLAQVFSAMGLQVDSLLGLQAKSDPAVISRTMQVRNTIQQGRLATRGVIWNLRHDAEAARPLPVALEEIPRLYDSVRAVVNVLGVPRSLSRSVENELFHIAQEAVSNAISHGEARHITLELNFEELSRVELWIRDDGIGFAMAATGEPLTATLGPRFGLAGMRERAARIGGILQVHSAPGVGTEVGVIIQGPT